LQHVVQELGCGEDRGVGLEGDFGAALGGCPDLFRGALGRASLELLLVHHAAAANLGLAPVGEEIHRLEADAVQAARGLVASLVEFAPHVEVGHDRFERTDFVSFFLGSLIVSIDGDAAAVVLDGGRAVAIDRDPDVLGEIGHHLVDRVVDQLINEVVQPLHAAVADVHAVAEADVLAVGELFNAVGVVVVGIGHTGGWKIGHGEGIGHCCFQSEGKVLAGRVIGHLSFVTCDHNQ
jgi:hypothetical protein